MAFMVKKRRAFSVKEKIRMIERLEGGASNIDVCRDMGVSQSTLSTIWKSRDHLKSVFYNDVTNNKKIKASLYKDIDAALIKWFKEQRSQNIPINKLILQEKADEFGKVFNKPNFKCSSSWITRFRKRHNIDFGKTISEEVGSVSENWLQTVWPSLRQDFADSDVYNAEETGLFYRLTPDRSMRFKGATCKGGKLSKERLTVLVAANMTGTDKRKLLVIGKSKIPCCFEKADNLPVIYKNNNTAWMTSEIFTHWLTEWEQELKKHDRKILLIFNNCPSHPPVVNLKNIKLVFLPPTTTSVVRPMNQGIINTLKVKFRKRLVLKIVNREEQDKELNISVLDAIRMLEDSWNDVSESTIKKCFRRAGFKSATDELDEASDSPDDNLNECGANLNDRFSPEELVSFAEVDKDLITSDVLPTDKPVVECITIADDAQNKVDDPDEVFRVPTLSEAFYSLDVVRAYVDAHPEISEQIPEVSGTLARIGNFMEASYC